MISRKNFIHTTAHRVFSAYFKDGKKTYMNIVPTVVVPWTLKPTPIKERLSRNSLGIKRKLPSRTKILEYECTNEEKLEKEVERLTNKNLDMEREMKLREKQLLVEISHLKNKLDLCKFTVDRFQHNKVHFKFMPDLKVMRC